MSKARENIDRLRNFVSIRKFGVVGNGITNDTAAIQSAIDSGEAIFVPAGTYKIDEILFTSAHDNQKFYGAGNDTIFAVNSGQNGFSLGGTWPGAAIVGIDLEGFKLLGSGYTGRGLNLTSVQRGSFRDIYCNGFDLGLSAMSVFGARFDNIRCENNNIGLKSHKTSVASQGFNGIDIGYLNVRANIKAGFVLHNGEAIKIGAVLAEGQPTGGYLGEELAHVSIGPIYIESNWNQATLDANAYTKLNRAGTKSIFALRIGIDEADVAAATSNKNIEIESIKSNSGEGIVYASYTDMLKIGQESGRAYLIPGPSLTNVDPGPGVTTLDAISAAINPNVGRGYTNGYLRRVPYNLIPNGSFNQNVVPPNDFPVAPFVSTETLGGITTNALAIPLADGSTTVTGKFRVLCPAASEFARNLVTVCASLHFKSGTSDIASVRLRILDGSSTQLATATKTAPSTTVFTTLGCVGAPAAETRWFYIEITITRTTGSGLNYLYVDEIELAPQNRGTLIPSPLDIYPLPLTGVTDTAGGGRFYKEFASGYENSADYLVTATAEGIAAESPQVVRNGATFRVYTTSTGITVTAQIHPLVMRMM